MQDNAQEELTERIKIIANMQDDLNTQLGQVYSEMNKARDKADAKTAKSTYEQIVYVMGHVPEYTQRTVALKDKFKELGERTQKLKYATVK